VFSKLHNILNAAEYIIH